MSVEAHTRPGPEVAAIKPPNVEAPARPGPAMAVNLESKLNNPHSAINELISATPDAPHAQLPSAEGTVNTSDTMMGDENGAETTGTPDASHIVAQNAELRAQRERGKISDDEFSAQQDKLIEEGQRLKDKTQAPASRLQPPPRKGTAPDGGLAQTNVDAKVEPPQNTTPDAGGITENPPIGTAAESSTGPDTKPLTTEDFAKETQTSAIREADIKTLRDKIQSGDYTMEDVGKLQELQTDPAQRQKDLEQKLLNGEQLSPKDIEDLKTYKEAEATSVETPEAKVQKQIDELTDKLADKLVKGEMPTQEEADRMFKLTQEKKMVSGGLFTQEEAKQAVQEAFDKKGLSNRREHVDTYVQDMLKKIAQNNLQIKAIPTDPQLRNLRGERSKLQDQARSLSTPQEERLRLYDQLRMVQDQINSYRHLAQRLRLENINLEASVRSKLGVTSGFRAIAENVAASTADVVGNMMFDALESAQDRLPGFANL